VTGWRVDIRAHGLLEQSVETSGDDTSVEVDDLDRGVAYTITVSVEADDQVSSPSPAADLTLAVPSRMRAPAATARNAASIKVGWKRPASRGAARIDRYQIRVYRGAHLVTKQTAYPWQKSIVVSGLRAHSKYKVGVRAHNVVGWSKLSKLRTVVTKRTSATQRWASETFGSFKTFTRSGYGDRVITLPAGARVGTVTATSDDWNGNFIVWTLGADNAQRELLVNTIGSYSGTTAYGLQQRGDRRLQIQASGAWTITVAPISAAPALPRSASGDGVYLYGGKARDLHLTTYGSGNVVAWQYGTSGYDALLINEVGAVDETEPLRAGPAVLTLQIGGPWRVRLE
jgi:hypothetical protein